MKLYQYCSIYSRWCDWDVYIKKPKETNGYVLKECTLIEVLRNRQNYLNPFHIDYLNIKIIRDIE